MDLEHSEEVDEPDDGLPRPRPWQLDIAIEPAPPATVLEPEWRALVERSAASVFLSWPWIATWFERRREPVHLARIAHRGTTVGLALLVERRGRWWPVSRALHLHATGDPDADRIAIEYNDVLAARGYEVAARVTLLDRLLRGRARPRARAVVLPMVDPAFEVAASAAGLRCRRRAQSRCAIVDLEAIRLWGQGYLQQLSPGTRAQIRRSARLYGARGALRIEAAADPTRALDWLEQLAALHEARFRAKGRRGAFGVPGFAAFHRALLARALPEGTAEILRVTAGQEPIGYLYVLLWRGWVGYYTSGFVYGEDNRLKPGLVCHWLAIERYLSAGARIYDFMAGESRYKASLAEPGPELVDLVVERDDRLAALAGWARRVRDRFRAWRSAGSDSAPRALALPRAERVATCGYDAGRAVGDPVGYPAGAPTSRPGLEPQPA